MKPRVSKRWDKMTTEEKAAYVADRAARERAAQGLPPKATGAQHRQIAAILADAAQRKERERTG